MLQALRGVGQTSQLAVRAYEGIEGFKQMLWHELKSKGEVLSLGGGDLEELVADPAWSMRHRERVLEAGYRIREILNSETDLPTFITNKDYLEAYTCRGISAHTVVLEDQIVIYNDVVAIYNWRHSKKVGIEIISKSFAETMRSVFESFWKLTEPTTTRSS